MKLARHARQANTSKQQRQNEKKCVAMVTKIGIEMKKI